MSILVQCRCGQSFQAEPFLAGKTVPCPRCHQPLAIPGQPAVPVAKPAVPVARPVTSRAPVARAAPPPVPVLPPMPHRPAPYPHPQPQPVQPQLALPPLPQAAIGTGPIVAVPKQSFRRRSSSSNVPIIVGAVAVIGLMIAGAVAVPFLIGSLPRTGLLAGGSSTPTFTPPIALPSHGLVCQHTIPQVECWLPERASYSEKPDREFDGTPYIDRTYEFQGDSLRDELKYVGFMSFTYDKRVSLIEAIRGLDEQFKKAGFRTRKSFVTVAGTTGADIHADQSAAHVVTRIFATGRSYVAVSISGTPSYLASPDAQRCLNSIRFWKPGQTNLQLGAGGSRRTTSR